MFMVERFGASKYFQICEDLHALFILEELEDIFSVNGENFLCRVCLAIPLVDGDGGKQSRVFLNFKRSIVSHVGTRVQVAP